MVVIGSILLGIAALLVLFGLVVFTLGLRRRVAGSIIEDDSESFIDVLIEFMKKCFVTMFDKKSTPAEVMMAAGAFFVLLGVGFIAASIVTFLISAFASGDGNGSGNDPSPSTTPSAPAPTT